MQGPEYGRTLDSAVIEQGLRELNPGLHFDMGPKIGQWHPYVESRLGVYYEGRHICSMDRGPVPEFKLWSVKERVLDVEWADADKEDVVIHYEGVSPWREDYEDLYRKALSGKHNNLQITPEGRLIELFPRRVMKAPDRVVRLGWRHTFEGILKMGVPGVTREAIAEKFGVDMMKFPVGKVDEMVGALTEE